MSRFILRQNFLGVVLLFTLGGEVYSQAVAELPPELAIPETDEGLPGAGLILREDWFQEVWNERRGSWQGREQEDQGALVFLGDSITQGWGEDFHGAFEGAKLANRGISGDTTRGMLIRMENDVLALNPRGIVMLMGTNDLANKVPVESIAGNVKLILEKLKDHDSDMPIVFCLVMPASAKKNRPADKIQELNRAYSQLVQGDPQINVIDTWTLFANADGDAKLEEFPDLLHPNELGYEKWAEALQPVLVKLGFLENGEQ